MTHLTFGQSAEGRRNNLDFLRFLFATLVIVSHSWPLLRGGDAPLAALSHHKADLGGVSVAAFFAISGFLIAKSYLYSRSLGDFFRKRALRIYPGWVVALLFCLLVVAPLSRPDHHLGLSLGTTLVFFEPLFLHSGSSDLPGVFPHNHYPGVVIGSTWTIPFEIMCYLLVALLGALGVLRRRPLVTALFVASVAFSVWPGRPQHISLRYFADVTPLVSLVTYFLAGTMLYVWRDVIPYSRRLCALAAVVLSVCLVLPVVPQPLFQLAFVLCGGYLLFSLAFLPTRRLHDFGKHGDLSYGLYLYAYPVQQLLVQYLGPHLTPVTLFLLAWLLTLGLAALSWRFIEEPCLRLKPRPQVSPAAVPDDVTLHQAPAQAPTPSP